MADYPEDDWDRSIAINLKGVWLCSDAASFVNGHNMAVDGGWAAQ